MKKILSAALVLMAMVTLTLTLFSTAYADGGKGRSAPVTLTKSDGFTNQTVPAGQYYTKVGEYRFTTEVNLVGATIHIKYIEGGSVQLQHLSDIYVRYGDEWYQYQETAQPRGNAFFFSGPTLANTVTKVEVYMKIDPGAFVDDANPDTLRLAMQVTGIRQSGKAVHTRRVTGQTTTFTAPNDEEVVPGGDKG